MPRLSSILDPRDPRSRHLPLGVRCLALLAAIGLFVISSGTASACVACHAASGSGLQPFHDLGERRCVACHQGNPDATDEAQAHAGLVSRPGEMDNATTTCGRCHGSQADSVRHSPMYSGWRMVATTRRVLEDRSGSPGEGLADLGTDAADSLLRKLCAGCHLGQPLTAHGGDPVDDRGGGCLACHLSPAAPGEHPGLTTQISDARCFGCHSRSGRIALSYAGIAEIESLPAESGALARLGDGRLVERLAADTHHDAGMACIDCHTGPGLMGAFADAPAGGIDIACNDCHANDNPRIRLSQSPLTEARRIPFDTTEESLFLTSRQGTPLWRIELHSDGRALLHPKLGAMPLEIPRIAPDHFALASEHGRLTCDACHAAWAPQCYGCHLSYDPGGSQWDHLTGKETPGEWKETRWHIRNAPPPLGRRADGHIHPFVPGMILTLDHPDRDAPLFVRRFAPLSPHTTGKARTCADCHRDPHALGLGAGRLEERKGVLEFSAEHAVLLDGLPADAWTSLARAPPMPSGIGPFLPRKSNACIAPKPGATATASAAKGPRP